MNEFEAQEFNEKNAQWQAIQPSRQFLCDRSRVAAVLRGDIQPGPVQRRRLRITLGLAVENLQFHVGWADAEPVEQRLRQHYDASMLALGLRSATSA